MAVAAIDQISVESDETALGAALGDDLDASGDEGAPVHWRGLPPLSETAAPPEGAEPLINLCWRRQHCSAACRTSAWCRSRLARRCSRS
ncbi:MAG: hypothetical protein U1E16_04780 [Hyphomicrobiales bacterium]